MNLQTMSRIVKCADFGYLKICCSNDQVSTFLGITRVLVRCDEVCSVGHFL